MQLKTLKMLVKLIDKGSFSVVADELNLTQPAVSMQIKSLEKKFDTNLVFRQGGEVKLTPAGKVVYHQAKQILNNWELAKLEVERLKGETYGQLVIGASTIPSEYLLPDLLAKFCNKFPEVKVLMEVGDSAKIVDNLVNREVDLVIVGFKPKKKEFKSISILEDRLVLILPNEHRLVNKNLVTINELEQERMLIREEGSGTRKAMLAGLNDAGISKRDLNIVVRLGSTESIISAVEAGVGISFVSELAARKAVDSGRVKQVEVADMLISRKLFLAYRREREEELLIKKFIEIF
ncbi:selenium metabolism-associated LysR family transcriptional regulator [Selenihalanaerobacter shriftii]|uniref:DNA-binding transcriptional regulator, LysR family n=1 Tax=Selenihalanaerobacter shriftii TaxID=142842 RepID=A0A1T4QGB0_9FIRM|nr:selenium metabolism-associated LysR family transcriptional regulator [Selenihalanaerobacter shriftii]SKA02759.1 DNA-binding transcriptional regulator, LysR family [Selenihalanaerobacter shriftii]